MRTVTTFVAAAVLALPLTARADDKAEAVKEIELKDLKKVPEFAGVNKPTEIASADELAKAIPDEDAVAKIKKDVDFAKVKLVLFSWQGSGGDKLTFSTEKDDVTFAFKAGLTRDLRPHLHLFAVPKDAKVKMAK
jgi:hypothetical protein